MLIMKIEDFAPTPAYNQTSNENSAWVVVTTTVSYPDGSRSQTSAIAAKPGSKQQ
jgi:hypothetical protein